MLCLPPRLGEIWLLQQPTPFEITLARSGGGGQRGVGGKFALQSPCLPLLSPDQCIFAKGLSHRFKRLEPISALQRRPD